ncbi:MAG: phosphoribosylformylglycinamidine synthase [Alphaproteobacteria bacterium]|nr:phosphoribosylformylglycinamidine synthase [Alphaproteobacteria bacterium]
MQFYISKKKMYQIDEKNTVDTLKQHYHINRITKLEIYQVYQFKNIRIKNKEAIAFQILAEKFTDDLKTNLIIPKTAFALQVALLPGQFNQKIDSATQCIKILYPKSNPKVSQSTLYIFHGNLSQQDQQIIKNFLINPINSFEVSNSKRKKVTVPPKQNLHTIILKNFWHIDNQQAQTLIADYALALTPQDILFLAKHYQKLNKYPSVLELKIFDTYWSDHCRHKTFNTIINNIQYPNNDFGLFLKSLVASIQNKLLDVGKKDLTLMNLATWSARYLKKHGKLEDVEISDEVNACSVFVNVKNNGQSEKWLVQFKNETHNHPTEIEPFGGAATCIGGAIRDPLSGRSYVFQALRISGSADLNDENLIQRYPEKIPPFLISNQAAKGFSSYGNQIGLATTLVKEFYHPGYRAKRFELGAVVGASPYQNILRKKPQKGDWVLLLGGRTGRDGIGGATGSSKTINHNAVLQNIAEVQKGNAIEERKLQRLFNNPEFSKKIKKCNDFGAGGIPVAIGELAPGVTVFLDKVKLKSPNLEYHEILLSESQERLAVVVSKNDMPHILKLAKNENVEASIVAEITNDKCFVVKWKQKTILSLPRIILDTNGPKEKTAVHIDSTWRWQDCFQMIPFETWTQFLSHKNICSQIGLTEMFDATIGTTTVLMPLGGKYQLSPSQVSAQKLPFIQNESAPISLVAFGFDPYLCEANPFLGGLYANIEALSKLVACGADFTKVHFSYQEYFPKLNDNPTRWSLPFLCLLGASYFQENMALAAIGGKDSMSGSYQDLDVPPSFVAFGFTTIHTNNIVSNEFKQAGSFIYLLHFSKNDKQCPDWEALKANYKWYHQLVQDNKILSGRALEVGGLVEAIFKMSIGNKIGCNIQTKLNISEAHYGYIVFESKAVIQHPNLSLLGKTNSKVSISINENSISLNKAIACWQNPYKNVFKSSEDAQQDAPLNQHDIKLSTPLKKSIENKASILTPYFNLKKIEVCLPIFPGTNCEYDTSFSWQKVGVQANPFVFLNMTPADIKQSILTLKKRIERSQIVCLSGGFSLADQPEGAGKYIAIVLKNTIILDALEKFWQRGGLILGICNGFQALVKSGLLPFANFSGDIQNDATLSHNKINKHYSGIVQTKIVSNHSPWLQGTNIGDIHAMAISHGEGQLQMSAKALKRVINNSQIGSQYVNLECVPTMSYPFNPNGSVMGIESICSPDGRIFGKMGHSERYTPSLYQNIPNFNPLPIFENAARYFRI